MNNENRIQNLVVTDHSKRIIKYSNLVRESNKSTSFRKLHVTTIIAKYFLKRKSLSIEVFTLQLFFICWGRLKQYKKSMNVFFWFCYII